MNKETKGPIAVLNLPTRTKDLITYGKKVSIAMTGNPHFLAPTPALTDLDQAVVALDLAETGMGMGPGKTHQRNAARTALALVLGHLRDYVQTVAEAQSTPGEAAAVIAGACLYVKKFTKPTKAELTATHGPLSGTVLLVARAAALNAIYYWQWSLDQETWADAPDTMIAKTRITGLQRGMTYAFRQHALTRNGPTEWSQVVSLLVQ